LNTPRALTGMCIGEARGRRWSDCGIYHRHLPPGLRAGTNYKPPLGVLGSRHSAQFCAIQALKEPAIPNTR